MADATLSVITATQITDAAKRPVANGEIRFTPIDASGYATCFGVSEGGNATNETVRREVVNGVMVGALSLVRSDMSVPVGINYKIEVEDHTSGEIVFSGIALIAAPTYDLGQFAPSTVETAPPAAWVSTGGGTGTSGTISVASTTTLAPGSMATVTNVGTATAASFAFGIPQGATGPQGPAGLTGAIGPQGPQGATGPAGSGGSGGGIASVGGLSGLFTSTLTSGAVTFALDASPSLTTLSLTSYVDNALTVGAASQNGYFVVNSLSGLFGIYNHDSDTYYGFSATPISPPANWAVLTGYFNGFGVRGLDSNPGNPLFAVANSTQYLGAIPAYQKLSFAVGGGNDVHTYNNLLDDGTGNLCVSGSIYVGASDIYSNKPTISSGTGVPNSGPPNGSLFQRLDGVAGSTLYVRQAGAWVAIA